MADLQRITTEYIDSEDRIRLSGELSPQSTVVLWLTQRLVNRLLPHLLGWLEQQAGNGAMGELFQGFAQQAAMATLEQQPPVQSAPQSMVWLVHAVNLTAAAEGVRLTFRGIGDTSAPEGSDAVGLTLHAQPLRQWLGILHAQYCKADWPLTGWPDWLTEAPPPIGLASHALLH